MNSLFILPILINLNCSTLIVESGEMVKRFGLGIEGHDEFDQLGSTVPVTVLEVVSGQNVNLFLPRIFGKVDHPFCVVDSHQALEGLHHLTYI